MMTVTSTVTLVVALVVLQQLAATGCVSKRRLCNNTATTQQADASTLM